MCGIVGNVLADPRRSVDASIVKKMADRIAHRGPDDEGFYVEGPVGLGARRLKIIDLEGGHQPLSDEAGTTWVAFNGEIYNYRELGAGLQARGHRLRTRCDTEIIAHLFEERALASLVDLDGMFGVAVWDAANRVLTLARDRLGIKPLYYAVLPDQIVFASELKAMVEHPSVGRKLDLVSLSQYLAHEYVPAPRSIFEGVQKLPPGHWLTYREGRVEIGCYWNVRFGGRAGITPEEASRELEATLDRVVRDHLVSDVPLGAFLSGGIDSSAVAAFASRHVSRLETFTIGFEDPSFDESGPARQVARALGTNHHEEILSPRVALDLVERLPDLLDEPLGDASILPTYLLSRFTRQGVTVALSGDGGDELFAGYPTYQAHRLARAYRRVPGWVRERVIRPAVERLPVSFDDLSVDFRLKRFVAGMGFDAIDRHAVWMASFTPEEQVDLFTADALARMESPPALTVFRELGAQQPEASELERIAYLDLKGYLGEGVLTKVDRASMACSLEVRPPLLDRRMVEFAASLPMDLKLRGFTTKWILKHTLRSLLPPGIVDRKKKGFGVPLARWFRDDLRNLVQDVFSPQALRADGLFRPEAISRIIEEHGQGRRDHRKKLYTLLAYQLWARRYRPS
jgi:asparagine synthase (glutamine-hydrolysing)